MAEIDEILQDLSHIPSEPDAQAAENYKQRLIALFSHFKAQVDNLGKHVSLFVFSCFSSPLYFGCLGNMPAYFAKNLNS